MRVRTSSRPGGGRGAAGSPARRLLPAVALLGLAAGTAPAATDAFRRDCEALAAGPHRRAGTPEAEAAFRHAAGRLAALQPDLLVTQVFPTVTLRTRRCLLQREADGRAFPLRPMRPNQIMPPVTPPEGLAGAILHGGDGTPAALGDRDLRGRIVVLDFNSGDEWLRAFRLGARAVIFVREGPCLAGQPHFVEASWNLPRFYYEGPRSDLPEGAEVRLHSEVTWEAAPGRNLLAWFRGTAPVFGQKQDEAIVLAAPLDSFGEVPDLAPGARPAANVAGALRLAAQFAGHRPRRHVLVALLDDEANAHRGAAAFYRAFERDNAKARLETRLASHEAEQAFVAQLAALLEGPAPLATPSPARRQLLQRLTDRAAEHAHEVGEAMYRLRLERQDLRLRDARGTATDADRGRIAALTRELDTRWQPDKDAWSEVRRALGRDRTEGVAPSVAGRVEALLSEVREDVGLRRGELDVEAEALRSERRVADVVGPCWIALHAALKLGDTTARWGLLIGGGGPMRSPEDNPGLYGKVQAVFLRAHSALAAAGRAPAGFEPASANQELPHPHVLWSGPGLLHSGEVAGLFGLYNLAFGTVAEATPREGTPDDTVERLDLDRIEAQIDEIGRMLSAVADLDVPAPPAVPSAPPARPGAGPDAREIGVADQEGLSLRRGIVASKEYVVPEFRGDLVTGPMVVGVLPGSSIPNRPQAGAVVQVVWWEPWALFYNGRKAAGYHLNPVLRTDRNGVYALGPLPGGWRWNGLKGVAAVFDGRGEVRAISDQESYPKIRERLNVFACRPGGLALPPSPHTGRRPADTLKLLSARDNGQLAPKKSYREIWDGVLCWYADPREPGVKIFGLDVLGLLGSGPPELARDAAGVDPLGSGFPMAPAWTPFAPTRQAAVDLWRLNESRLRLLEGKNILNSSLAELHGRAEDLLLAAQGGPAGLAAEALDASALMASRPVYRQVRSMIDDLVFAVLILLGLAVPFAFALERVVVGATTVYRQIGWFCGFFVATFVVLFLTHPAFAIANTPIVIFLGFAVLILSVLVISLILRKFEVELRALQGMTATVHAADVSRVSTLLAAMQMGISTMRRRPLRTALTAVTIILLTFTILSFASFTTESGIVRLFAAPAPAYTGAWVHHVNWAPLGPDLLDVVRRRWAGAATVCERRWVCPQRITDADRLLTRDDGAQPVRIKGILGLEPAEVRRRPDLARLIDAELEDAVLLTPPVARALGVAPGDWVRLGGARLRVGRPLDEAALSAAVDMDQSSVLPVDFTEQRSARPAEESVEQQLAVPVNWTALPVNDVVVVSAATASRLGGATRGVALYTDDAAAAAAIAGELARMLPVPVAATLENGVYRHLLGTVVAASGAGDLLFPILLGGLVIFGTMLGSVADREREIYTFSALGLAPRHVATLFFAESVVYSLIGGMGGYLLAQATVRVLHVLAAHGWARVPPMNVSSTNTIVTILIVMGTVLLSAVYPAIKASHSANPGLMRTWRPPPPKGDRWDLVFPFTVSEYDITGVVSFLREHFDAHNDTGLGRFMATDTALGREPDGVLGLRSFITLAPFDLGVSQAFLLRSTPSEIPGIDEVRIALERRSGQPGDWTRLNRVLLDDLRQQFLIWRSLPQETMEQYRARTLAALAPAPPGAA